MKHVIVGTAGHIDHGKTTLIRALTSIDTDRLREEKERGITIDLGFAYFDLPSGRRAGIVDVPGHERFIKNMLAGAGGIDVVILVIAADEGIMPQTLEHLHILSLLQTKQGLVALTKTDLVEDDWLELVMDDTRTRLKGTFLEDAPIIPLSALTGEGLERLVQEVDRLTADVPSRDDHLPFRLPIDRVFSVTGFGTVVTGTVLSGTIKLGQAAEVYPDNRETRIRSIQVHGQKVEAAYAGQRAALNLAGLEVADLNRGDVLAAPGLLRSTLMLDVRLELLADADKPVQNRDRLRFYIGTSEVLCRAVLLDAELLMPGDKALVQLRLEEPVAVQAGDRFVVRTYSPMYTIGGGSILDAHPRKRKRFKEAGIQELMQRESGGDLEILNQTLLQHSDQLLTSDELFRLAGRPAELLEPLLEELQAADIALAITVDGKPYFLHADYLQQLASRAARLVSDYHRRFPLRPGMPKEELRSRLNVASPSRLFNSLLTLLLSESQLQLQGSYISNVDFQVEFTGKHALIREHLMQALQNSPYSPPDIEDLALDLNETAERVGDVILAMAQREEVVKVSADLALLRSAVDQAREIVVNLIRSQGSITLADLRDQLQTSRKYALALLDYFDAEKVTQRKGDVRTLHRQFVSPSR
ncbi:MAG: selenocysteine-specific translation elongation factor [Bacillota bacterium]|jgi:selenocysteine-specific elongation factor